MAIVKWNPGNLSSILDDDWDMPTLPARVGQGLNVYETEDSIVAEAAMPGVSEKDIEVSVDDGVVHVTGSSSSTKENKEGRRYFMSSMASTFNYSFRLPEGVAGNKEPKAEVEHGVLYLNFPKAAKTEPKKIKVGVRGEKKA